VEAIKRAREEGGPFTSLWDFCERVDARTVNKRSIEALIKCGAFGSTRATRRGMLEVLDSAQSAGQRAQQDLQRGQGSIFDLAGVGDASPLAAPSYPAIPTHEHERTELLAMEKESIGIFISEHPLKRVARGSEGQGRLLVRQGHGPARRRVGEGRRDDHGVQEDPHPLRHHDDVRDAGRPRWRGRADGVREVARGGGEGIAADAIVLVRGRVDHKEAGKVCVIVRRSRSSTRPTPRSRRPRRRWPSWPRARPSAYRRRVGRRPASRSVVDDLRELFERYSGDTEFVLEMHTRSGLRRLRFGDNYKVKAREAGFKAELEGAAGRCHARRRLALARGDAALAQRDHVLDVLGLDGFALVPGALEDRRQPLESAAR